MPGGPINGSGSATAMSIIVPTVLQMAADVVSWFTSLTCLYDPYWAAETGRITLPVCMFHVKKITPAHTVETSKKRVILYEQQDSSAADKADSMRPSVMRTIIDNAVKQPTTYSMEVIVPFQPLGRYFTENAKMVTDMAAAFTGIFAIEGKQEEVQASYETAFASVFALLKTWNTVTGALTKLPGSDGAAYINMNSLEAMADTCRTLCMKMWTGYDYKFVMITGLSFEKQPQEDDAYRATLSLQEVPVLAVSPPKPYSTSGKGLSPVAKAAAVVQSALVTPLVQFTGVKEAATGNGKVGTSLIDSVLGQG